MVDIDFDALAQLPNLLTNGDFSAGNDDSPSRIPGWERYNFQRNYGEWFWLDYGPTGQSKPPVTLDMNRGWSTYTYVLEQVIGPLNPDHRYAVIVDQEVEHPQGNNPSMVEVGFLSTAGGRSVYRVDSNGRPGAQKSAIIANSWGAVELYIYIGRGSPFGDPPRKPGAGGLVRCAW